MNPNSTKSFSWTAALLICLGAAVVAVVLSVFIQTRGIVVDASTQDPQPVATTTVATGSGSSFEVPGQPVRLIIPAIGVNANVQSVGNWWRVPTDMGIPTNFTDVAWYNLGPKPGEPGSAVIDGHLDGATVQQAVFYNLGKLKPGDDVQVVDNTGKTLHFTVVATKFYDASASTTEIFNNDPSKIRLNLITCAGDWIKTAGQYDQRVVVFTELVQ